MEAIDRLMAHMRKRPLELEALKQKGTKIVGYVPNGYMPEELLYASGMVPIGLLRGGDHEPVIASQACLFRFIDTFCRAHIGYRLLGKELLYQLPDLLTMAYTDRNMFAIGEMWLHYTDVPVLKIDVPRYNHLDHAFQYYVAGLRAFKRKLDDFTGKESKDETLKQEIDISNRIRSLLEEISNTRKAEYPPISGKDFIRLNHATYYCDRPTLLKELEAIVEELNQKQAPKQQGLRIMLTGSTLAEGDSKIVDLLEESGANIVIEEFSEGVRHYWQKVPTEGEPIVALADRYLRKRTPPAFFKSVTKERFDFLMRLIAEFKVQGVVWYSLMYRDSYDREALLFSRVLEKEGIPFIKISSDYDEAETGAMRTRIHAFIESIEQRRQR